MAPLTSRCWTHRRLAGLVLSIAAAFLPGCTRAELEHKADAYNQAIAESNNRQILLNAVRASQRAPMSFVGFGDVAAAPNFSGTAAGTFNFDPLGLTTYNLNPALNVNGGFSSFTMNNLNYQAFAHQLQLPIKREVFAYFEALRFPKELVRLIFVQEYTLPTHQYRALESEARARCAAGRDERDRQICGLIQRDIELFEAAGCQQFPITGETVTRLNSGRDLCSMVPFLTLERQRRLLNTELPFKMRTSQGILYFLGELIAAQNYSAHPFLPEVLIETTDNIRHAVPLFEVRRGPVPSQAAVAVLYNGENFYIPTPAFGAIEEARSLQVLDLVSQAITAATSKDALPKSSTITLVPSR